MGGTGRGDGGRAEDRAGNGAHSSSPGLRLEVRKSWFWAVWWPSGPQMGERRAGGRLCPHGGYFLTAPYMHLTHELPKPTPAPIRCPRLVRVPASDSVTTTRQPPHSTRLCPRVPRTPLADMGSGRGSELLRSHSRGSCQVAEAAAADTESGPEPVPGLCPVLPSQSCPCAPPLTELSSCPVLSPSPTGPHGRPAWVASSCHSHGEETERDGGKKFAPGLGLEQGFEPMSAASKA